MRSAYFKLLTAVIVIFGLTLASATAGAQPTSRDSDGTRHIELADGSTVVITESFDPSYAYLNIQGMGITIELSWYPDWPEGDIWLNSANAETEWMYSQGLLNLETTSTDWAESSSTDISSYPENYRDLWSTVMDMCELLNDSRDFWSIMRSVDDDIQDKISEFLEDVSYGDKFPTGYQQLFMVMQVSNSWAAHDRLSWGFTFEGQGSLSIMTTDEYGTDSPEVFIELYDTATTEYWDFRLNPVDEILEISNWSLDPYNMPDDDSVWLPVYNDVVMMVESYLNQSDILVEMGLIDDEDGFGWLMEKTLYGLTEYNGRLVDPAIYYE